MAEAHEAVAFQFIVGEDGIYLDFNAIALKNLLIIFYKGYLRRYRKIRNSILQGAYPSHKGHFVIIILCLLWIRYFLYRSLSFWPYSLMYQYLPFTETSKDLIFILVSSIILWALLAISLQYILKFLLMYQGWIFIDRKSANNWNIKIWAMCIRVLCFHSQELLYSYQRSLPKLPVPPLKQTLQRYVNSMEPLQTPEEFQKTRKLAFEFENGIGKELQTTLSRRSYFYQNYVTEWWEKYIYLGGGRNPKEASEHRSPYAGIMINSNYYCLDQIFFRTPRTQASRAASMSHCMLEWKNVIETERCAPLKMNNLIPLCTWQYERLFGTCRIPHKQYDEVKHWHGKNSQHLVVLRNGNYYKIECYKKGKLLQAKQLEKCFQQILNDTHVASAAEKQIASFTSLDRDEWAQFRERYLLTGKNKRNLDIIERAAFFLVLDDQVQNYGEFPSRMLTKEQKHFEKNQRLEHPTAQFKDKFSAYSASALHGSGGDRWFDKNFNVIVYKNGIAALNVEHSFCDAPIVGHLYEVVSSVESDYMHYEQNETTVANKTVLLQQSQAKIQQLRFNKDGTLNGDDTLPACHYERLDWNLNQEAADRIEIQYNLCLRSIGSVDLKVCFFPDFGQNGIKAIKCSPDAFLQMALQLTYYKNQKRFDLTYESAMTRLFREGRTETIRPVTVESCKFVRAMMEEPRNDLKAYRLLLDSMKTHGRRAREAMVGKGCDRHLFCLYILSQGTRKNSPFLNAFINNNWRLSTSQTPTNQTGLNQKLHPEVISGGGGFGPVTKHGYGVSYIFLRLDVLVLHVCSFKDSKLTNSQTFMSQMFESLRSMHSICQKSLAEIARGRSA